MTIQSILGLISNKFTPLHFSTSRIYSLPLLLIKKKVQALNLMLDQRDDIMMSLLPEVFRQALISAPISLGRHRSMPKASKKFRPLKEWQFTDTITLLENDLVCTEELVR